MFLRETYEFVRFLPSCELNIYRLIGCESLLRLSRVLPVTGGTLPLLYFCQFMAVWACNLSFLQ